MATLPKATTTVDNTAGAVVGGLDTVCVLSPVATLADATPRIFGSAAAIYAAHGYSEGLEYAALHIQRTGKAVMFIGLPISDAGVVGRENKSGNSGTCVTTVTAGGTGVLAEHDGVLKVKSGGTIGTSQIVLQLSLDGGRKFKDVRLGTANSYTIPYVGVSVAFAAGTLVAGDTIHTWHGTAPASDSAGWADAREALAAQQKGCRSLVLCGRDLSTDTQASDFLAQLNAYETANERFVYGRASVRDRLPEAALSNVTVRMTGTPTLTYAEVGATADTITRSTGSWISDGFVVGDAIDSVSPLNTFSGAKITGVTATVLTLDTQDLAAEVTAAATIVGHPGITYAEVGATGDTITRNRGSWLDDGFRVGSLITSNSALNDFSNALVTAVTATVLTLDTQDLSAEFASSGAITITAGESKALWMAALDTEFAPVDAAKRISLSAGRGRATSPFTDWYMRRPAGWFASFREYSHDLHVATWRKSDGPVDADLFDANGTLVEWDERIDGGAGLAARFTTLRTWGNGPNGAFVSLSLTRASDGDILQHTAKLAVTNLACGIVQLNSENAAIGQDLILNDDGTATADSLATIENRVNAALDLELLTDKLGEGPRASNAVWRIDPSTDYRVAEPVMAAVLQLDLNGTVHSVNTRTRLNTPGS